MYVCFIDLEEAFHRVKILQEVSDYDMRLLVNLNYNQNATAIPIRHGLEKGIYLITFTV